jgi:orotate phosphoribosyltransferase
MDDDDVLALFRSCGALLNGHFVLTSGRHSDTYFEKFHVLRHPHHVEALCIELARRVRATPAIGDVDVVMGPTTLGIVLAYEVGKQLGVPVAYAEKSGDGTRHLRRAEHLARWQRVLIVDDVLTTGGSVRECLDLVRAHGAVPAGVGVLVDRSGGTADFGVPLLADLSLDVRSYDPDDLPDELLAIPALRPGSTGKH